MVVPVRFRLPRWRGDEGCSVLKVPFALTLVVLLSRPTFAQQGNATITLRLTLYGDAPAGEYHAATVNTGGDAPSSAPAFCGPDLAPLSPPCTSSADGVICTALAQEPPGREVIVTFRRGNDAVAQPEPDVYARAEFSVTGSATIVAYYDYGTGEGGLGDGSAVDQQDGDIPDGQQAGADTGQQKTPSMPATGGGGRMGADTQPPSQRSAGASPRR